MSANINMDMARAVVSGDTPTVRRLIGEGVDVNANESAYSPLSMACNCGHQEVVRILLEAGADKEQLTS